MKDIDGSRMPGNGAKPLNLDTSMIPDERKKELSDLAEIIHSALKEPGQANVIFICTHNSRRSQLAQVWFHLWIDFFGLKNLHAFSGGTEATSFNIRMVDAMNRAGFEMDKLDQSGNPHYRMKTVGGDPAGPDFFSKVYAHPANPQKDFIAVMVCDQADADCPFIPGAYKRFSLPYEDPKRYDGTEEEALAYDLKVLEVGREMYLLARKMAD